MIATRSGQPWTPQEDRKSAMAVDPHTHLVAQDRFYAIKGEACVLHDGCPERLKTRAVGNRQQPQAVRRSRSRCPFLPQNMSRFLLVGREMGRHQHHHEGRETRPVPTMPPHDDDGDVRWGCRDRGQECEKSGAGSRKVRNFSFSFLFGIQAAVQAAVQAAQRREGSKRYTSSLASRLTLG